MKSLFTTRIWAMSLSPFFASSRREAQDRVEMIPGYTFDAKGTATSLDLKQRHHRIVSEQQRAGRGVETPAQAPGGDKPGIGARFARRARHRRVHDSS